MNNEVVIKRLTMFVERIAMALERMSVEPRWYDVNEKMPEVNRQVLCCNAGFMPRVCRYDGVFWRNWRDDIEVLPSYWCDWDLPRMNIIKE